MPERGQDKKAVWSMGLEPDISTPPGTMGIDPKWGERGASGGDEDSSYKELGEL